MAVLSDHDILLALGEDLPVGIWVARAPSGELVYANRMFADITGMDGGTDARGDTQAGGHAEAFGIYTRDGARYPESKLPFARVLAERCAIAGDDLAIRRRDGRFVDVRVIARPVGDPITHVVVMFFDKSRAAPAEATRAEREQRLRHAQRLVEIGTLASGIAQDLDKLLLGIEERPRVAVIDPPKGKDLILIVDDDSMVRKVIAGTLDSFDYRTIEAVSGTNAIEIYRARHGEIRAVVLDMVMPDMSGKATYLALRQIDANVPVLLMTGHMLNAQVQELLDLGVRSFLSKPYSIAELAAAIAELTR